MVIDPDIILGILDIVNKIGSTTEANTVLERLNKLIEGIGDISTPNSLIERINDLSLNRIGNVNTENTLNWLLDKIRGVEGWRIKKMINLYSLWGIVTTNGSYPCFIGTSSRVVFRNFVNGTNNIGQIILPYNLISWVWNVPNDYTTDVRGFAWDGSNLWTLVYKTSGDLMLCRIVDYTANPWSFDREYLTPGSNDCKGLIYRNGRLITYRYNSTTGKCDFYGVDPSNGNYTLMWSTDAVGSYAGNITYDSKNDWILIIEVLGYSGLIGLDPDTGEEVIDLTNPIASSSGYQLYGVAYSEADNSIWTDNGTTWRQFTNISLLNIVLSGFDSEGNIHDVLIGDSGELAVLPLSVPNPPNLDVALSSRLSESTFTNRIGTTALQNVNTTDSIAYILKTDGVKIGSLPVTKGDWLSDLPNPSNLDVALSSRLADNKFPTAITLSDNIGNPTTTLVGASLLGWEPSGAKWIRLQCDSEGRLKVSF